MAHSADSKTSTSIGHVGKLLESVDINDKSAAITALSHLSTNKEIIQSMFENEIHLSLMQLLRPFKNQQDEQDCIEGEQLKPVHKLTPHLTNELLQILINLVCDDEFFDGSMPYHSFKRIINILKHENYKKICQINVYSLIEAAIEIEPEILCVVIDDIIINRELILKFPADTDAMNAFLRLLARITEYMQEVDAAFPDRMIRSNLLNELIPIMQNTDHETNGLGKIYCYDILWNLCQSYHSYAASNGIYGDDDKNDEKDAIYDWLGTFNHNFCVFISSYLGKQHFEYIGKQIAEFANKMNNDMESKWGNKKKNKNKKTTDCVFANEQDLAKWTKEKNNIIDAINTVRIAMDLYLKIFENGQIMLPYEENKEEEEEEDDADRRRRKKSILSLQSRNKVCGLVVDHWLNNYNKFEINQLIQLSDCVGIDFKAEIGDLIQELSVQQIGFLSEFITESVVSLSSSQWQKLWDFGCKIIAADNNKSNQVMDDVLYGENGEDIMKIMRMAVDESWQELDVTNLNVEELLRLHGRIRNCQHSLMQFNIKNFNVGEDYFAFDLIYVHDMNGYNQDINNILANLFKMDSIKTNKDCQRLILETLYSDVEVLSQNVEFIDVLIKYYKEDKDENVCRRSWSELLYEWNGIDSMHIGFETTQIILDIMMIDDEYLKLAINKKKFKSILKYYKMVERQWKNIKVMVEETNENIKNGNENKEKEIEWETIDTITKPIKECIININNFLESQE